MSDIKIFVSHRIDQDSVTIDNPLYVNVRSGAVFDKRKDVTMLGDDTGDNISEKQKSYDDLTVLYWAWKNQKMDYVGFCSYNTYFCFNEEKWNRNNDEEIVTEFLGDEEITKINLSSKFISQNTEPYDFLILEGKNIKKSGYKSVYEFYRKSKDSGEIYDIDLFKDVVKDKFPQFDRAVDQYFSASTLYCHNMFIMKYDLFQQYCTYLFKVLFEVEKIRDLSKYSRERLKFLAMLGNHFLGIYYTYLLSRNEYKMSSIPIVHIVDTTPMQEMLPAFEINNIPITLVSSDFYVPYCSTMILSILRYINNDKNYDIIIFEKNITSSNKKMLKSLGINYSNVSIRFYNVAKQLSGYKLDTSFYTIESFVRSLIPFVLTKYQDKVIYLDSDMIIKSDLAELYEIDLGNNLLSAVRDPIWLGFVNGAKLDMKKYSDEILHLKDTYNYFNSGVHVFNLKEFRNTLSADKLLTLAQEHNYIHCDQDVLNIVCEGRVKFLDMSWNTLNNMGGFHMAIIASAPADQYSNYLDARKAPKIIHYAGAIKPWQKPDDDFADEFWTVARKNPQYEIIVHRLVWETSGFVLSQRQGAKFIVKLKKAVKDFLRVFFPRNTPRHAKIKQAYFRFRGWPTDNVI